MRNVTVGMRQATVAKCVADDQSGKSDSQQDVGSEGQTVDYHVDMRHVADVADSRQQAVS